MKIREYLLWLWTTASLTWMFYELIVWVSLHVRIIP